MRSLLGQASLAREQAEDSLQSLVEDGQVLVLDASKPAQTYAVSSFLISRSGWNAQRERMETLLAGYHRQFPLRAGMPREEVKSRLARYIPALTPRLFTEILSQATDEGWLSEAGPTSDRVRLTTHQPSLSPKQQQAVDYLLYTFRQSPYTTPSVTQCEDQVGDEVLNALIEQGQLTRLNEDVILLTETYEEMKDRIIAQLEEHNTITVAQVRDIFQTSRKYALALLGYLDEKRITRRVGDERVLR
jgi:selenocysteine-specific elongation factor